MANIDTMGDAGTIVTGVANALSNVFSSWNQTEQQRINADLQKSLNKSSNGANEGSNLNDYLPWIVGGVLGVGVLIFLMRK